LDELKDRAEQLQNLVKKLQREEITLPQTLIPLYEKKGNLPWPLTGRIVTRYGDNRHHRFNTVTHNNGIEISPQKDTVVKAIHAGRVAYTDYFEGYGYLVIIDHGMTYYSLYGHLSSEFLVKKGDFVKQEQPIATVGEFGSLKEETLYFEIRYKTDPVNPLHWLKRR
jgi:septal ring factor EnvC (AmiA/AmiB activator)